MLIMAEVSPEMGANGRLNFAVSHRMTVTSIARSVTATAAEPTSWITSGPAERSYSYTLSGILG